MTKKKAEAEYKVPDGETEFGYQNLMFHMSIPEDRLSNHGIEEYQVHQKSHILE